MEWNQTRDFSDYFCPANYSKENVCQCATTPLHYELTSVWRFWLYIKPRRAKKYFLHWGLQVSLVEHFDGREKRNPGGACSDGFSWLSGLLTKSFIGKARQKLKFLANNSATGIVNARNCKSNVEKRIELSTPSFKMSFPVRCRFRIIVLKQQIRKCFESKEVRFEL